MQRMQECRLTSLDNAGHKVSGIIGVAVTDFWKE